MIILGLNAFHADSSAALIRDGRVIAAAEEERFRRIKHWAGFPSDAIGYCLREAGVRLGEVDLVAINTNARANLMAKLGHVATKRPELGLILSRLKTGQKRRNLIELFAESFPDDRGDLSVIPVEHHVAHMASAYFVSPFRAATVVSVDGFGDFASTAWGTGENDRIDVEGRIYFPHSLGIFYLTLTQFLGFPNYGDEYKVMGLAPYGEPRFMSEMRRIVHLKAKGQFALNLDYFIHDRERVDTDWLDGRPTFRPHFAPALADLLGPARGKDEPLTQRHMDIARSVQAMYEEAFFHLIGALHERHKLDAITLAGGCAMNSVANGKIKRQSPFKRVYIQSAAGDAGGAIGAALAVWHGSCPQSRTVAYPAPAVLKGDGLVHHTVMDHAYLGPAYSDDEIGELLQARAADIAREGCVSTLSGSEGGLLQATAEAVANGQVIGWYQGRMEWGPRALGNRSIVCDPRRADMKDILNLKIKRRESFRPFAPSILKEHTAEWFEEDDDVPFMMQVFQIREEKRKLIPAVTHADGSGRLQTVYRETNPRYWGLIEAFRGLTGVPMVLNTSFNENEPVVCRPQEALDCFLRTKMDLLVMGRWMVRR